MNALHKAAALVAAAISLALGVVSSATAAPQGFSGKTCGLVAAADLSAAGITDACVQGSSHATAALATYGAHWGAPSGAHYLTVTIFKPNVDAAIWYAAIKAGASRNLAPIKIGSWAYWTTDRFNGERRHGRIMFRVGSYVCLVGLEDDNGAPDETGLAHALFMIAKTMTARLS